MPSPQDASLIGIDTLLRRGDDLIVVQNGTAPMRVLKLSLSPDQPLVLNYLAYSWVERGENIDKALKMLQRAVDQRPDDGLVIDSLGWAYYRLGQYDKAVEVLETAIQFSPYESTLNEHLGDAYWKTGRKREARFLWRHALKLKPEDERIPILQAKMKGGLEAGEALESRSAASAP